MLCCQCRAVHGVLSLPCCRCMTLQVYLALSFVVEAMLMGLHKKHTPLDRVTHECLFYSMLATAGTPWLGCWPVPDLLPASIARKCFLPRSCYSVDHSIVRLLRLPRLSCLCSLLCVRLVCPCCCACPCSCLLLRPLPPVNLSPCCSACPLPVGPLTWLLRVAQATTPASCPPFPHSASPRPVHLRSVLCRRGCLVQLLSAVLRSRGGSLPAVHLVPRCCAHHL